MINYSSSRQVDFFFPLDEGQNMPHVSARVVQVGGLLLLAGAILFSVSIGLDTFVDVTYTPTGANSSVTDKFGIFTYEVDHDAGMYSGSPISRYSVSCDTHNARLSATEKTGTPTGGCLHQCGTKKAFAIIGAAAGFFAVAVLMDFKDGSWSHLWIHREGFGFRVASAVAATVAFFSGIIVLALVHQEMGTQSHVVNTGTSQEYSEKFGICAYKLKTSDALTIESHDDPVYGEAYSIMIAATVAYGIGALATAVTMYSDSAIEA